MEPQELVTLQTFIIDGWAVQSKLEQIEAEVLTSQLFTSVKTMKKVAFRGGSLALVSMVALFPHAQTLYDLDIRKFEHHAEHSESQDGERYLKLLAGRFTRLTDLTVELPHLQPCPKLNIWCSYLAKSRNLRRLLIIGPAVSFGYGKRPKYVQMSFKFVQHLMNILLKIKEGIPIQELRYRRPHHIGDLEVIGRWHGIMIGGRPVFDCEEANRWKYGYY